jgi:peroxiredoxin
MLPLGTPLPDFNLPAPNADMHGPSDMKDAPALLVAFLCNHCPYVQHIADELGKMTAEWAADGLATIGVTSNDVAAYPEDGPNRMNGFAGLHGWTFPYVYDETQEVAKAFGAACTPDFFLFDRDRRLAYRGQFDGSRPGSGTPVTGADLDAAVRAVLDGRPVEGDQQPSVGCSIKWKPGNEPDYA